eukprot:5046424-Lingulodinium_polyedra.AAC.1
MLRHLARKLFASSSSSSLMRTSIWVSFGWSLLLLLAPCPCFPGCCRQALCCCPPCPPPVGQGLLLLR